MRYRQKCQNDNADLYGNAGTIDNADPLVYPLKMKLCRKGLHAMTGENIVFNNGRPRCKACWLQTRRRIRKLQNLKSEQPAITVGSTLPDILRAVEAAKGRAQAFEAALEQARRKADRAERLKDRADKEARKRAEELEAAVALVQELESLYKKRADLEGVF